MHPEITMIITQLYLIYMYSIHFLVPKPRRLARSLRLILGRSFSEPSTLPPSGEAVDGMLDPIPVTLDARCLSDVVPWTVGGEVDTCSPGSGSGAAGGVRASTPALSGAGFNSKDGSILGVCLVWGFILT